jgi:hypothetical protein
MISSLIKVITVDGFFSSEEASRLCSIARSLQFQEKEFGHEIEHFNLVPDSADELFSSVFNTAIEVDQERSGVFRVPRHFIHFESFDSINEWIFVCALERSFLTIYEHIESGSKTALDKYDLNYRDMLGWDYQAQHQLSPGQGVLFRPWLFHSMDCGLVQIFRLREVPK